MKGEADRKHAMTKRNPNQKSKTQRELCWHSTPSSTLPAEMEGCNVSLMRGRGQSGDCPEIMGTRRGWQWRALWREWEWVLRLEEMVSRVMARASWKGEISYFPRQSWRQSQKASNPLFFITQNKWPAVRASQSYPAAPWILLCALHSLGHQALSALTGSRLVGQGSNCPHSSLPPCLRTCHSSTWDARSLTDPLGMPWLFFLKTHSLTEL